MLNLSHCSNVIQETALPSGNWLYQDPHSRIRYSLEEEGGSKGQVWAGSQSARARLTARAG